jgi:hypothetical protein
VEQLQSHSGAVAKPFMRKGFLIFEEIRKYFPIYEEAVSHISYIRKPFLICDFATAPL